MKANNEQKKQKINYGLTAVVALILITIAVSFVTIYPGLHQSSAKNYETYDDYQFMTYLGKFNYVLINDTLETPKDFETLTSQYLDLSYIADEDKERVKKAFKDIMTRWTNSLTIDASSLKYYVLNNTNNKVNTNMDSLKGLIDGNNIEQLAGEYEFLMKVQFDDTGKVNVQYVKGATETTVEDIFRTFVDSRNYTVSEYFTENIPYSEEDYRREYEDYYGGEDSGYPYEEFLANIGSQYNTVTTKTREQYEAYGAADLIKTLKNVTFVYGIETDTPYYDELLYNLKWSERNYFEGLNVTCIMLLMGLALLIALFIPYQYERNMAATRVVLRFPVEILVGLGFMGGFLVVFTSFYILPEIVAKEFYNDLITVGLPENFSNWIRYTVLVGSIFGTLAVAFEGMVVIKHIFHVGLFRYFKTNIFIFRVIGGCYRKIKNMFVRVFSVDFSDSGRNKLRFMMIVHTVITIVLCVTWFFGIFLAIIYNGIVYTIIRNKYLKIRTDYSLLLGKTKNIAEGNLDVSIQDELGMFNPVRDEINNIREGLKKAVEEEVKSQNMKTELISNVSHDLKTPLTSIITYVDLLKHGDLTQEQQKEYIDVLERKSQRLKVLIEDLFEMSKTASQNLVLNYVNLDLVTLTKEVLVEFEDKLKEANLLVKSDYQCEKVICYLDSQKSYRIIENLIGNIIKYAMPYTRVYITVTTEGSEGIMVFKNISASELNCRGEELMERFVRGDASRNSNTEGSGLGLAIAKGLTEVQGGSIAIDVDGDLFKVTLKFPISTVIEEREEEHTTTEARSAESQMVGAELPDTKESEWKEEDWVKAFYEDLPPQIIPDEPIPFNQDEIAKEVGNEEPLIESNEKTKEP